LNLRQNIVPILQLEFKQKFAKKLAKNGSNQHDLMHTLNNFNAQAAP